MREQLLSKNYSPRLKTMAEEFETYLNSTSEFGTVTQVHYPMISIEGLPKAHPFETLIFEDGQMGQVFDMEYDLLHALVFSVDPINIGSKVTRTNQTLSIPVGDTLRGATVDPLGRPTRLAKVFTTRNSQRQIFTETIGIDRRVSVNKPFLTGITKVDLLIPLGRGQRDLILGDAKTGKTNFLLNSLVNQVQFENTIGIYAAIGKKTSEVKYLEAFFEKQGIAQKIILVAATSADPTSMIYLAPYSAMAIAEYFRDQGQHTVVILDDMTTHAQRYREISLMSRRFPGRESYPGDIFYAHASLVERAGNFKHEKSGEVSITCLTVASTVEGDISGYISTNLISMTDGHIFFDTEIYNKGERPAINIPLSVTRVGRKTQSSLLREINREILSLLSQYRNLIQIAHLDSEMSLESKELLQKGRSMMGMLDQATGTIPYAIQIVLFGVVWLDAADLSSEIIYQGVLNDLMSLFKNPAERKEMILITSSKNLDEFLLRLKQKQDIIDICNKNQISQTK